MSALKYLIVTTLKNKLLELKKHPAKLIAYFLFLALMVFVIIVGNIEDPNMQQKRPIAELGAILFVFYASIFAVDLMKGFSSGATFFKMSDVNLLFVSPTSPKRILFYGLLRQAGMTLWIGFFIFFQYGWLRNTYGINFGQLLLIFLGYGLSYFCGEVCAMAIYICTNGNEKRKRLFRWTLYGIAAVLVGLVVFPVIQNQLLNPLATAIEGTQQPLVMWFPVIGWMKTFAYSFMTGNWLPGVIALMLMFAFIGIMVAVIIKIQSDYYEDVLQATEITFTQLQAVKEGKVQEMPLGAKVKAGATGIKKGKGAGVFFYKHMLENRRSKVFLFDKMTMIFLIMGAVMAFFMKDAGIIVIFGLFTYFQIFTSATGRWLKELTQPYVYLIPQPPFQKLILLCGENIYRIVLEAFVSMTLIGIVMGASVPEIIACIFARMGFGILFGAGNIGAQRILGGVINKGLLVCLYFVVMIVVCIPSVIVGVVVGMMSPIAPIPFALLFMMVINVLLSLLIVFLCRNVLDNIELNNQ